MSRLPSSKTAQIWAERIAQCERFNAAVAQFCQSIGCSPMFSSSGVVQRDLWGRRTGSPSYSVYDGLPVRRASRTGGLIGATDWKSVVQGDQNANSLPRQATAFLRVQTSDSTKDLIEIKLPSGISILVPVSAVESISAILEQVT